VSREETIVKVKKIRVLLIDHRRRKQILREMLELCQKTKIKEGQNYEKKGIWAIVTSFASGAIGPLLGWFLKKRWG